MDSFERYAKLTLDNLPELLSWLSADLRYTWVNSKYAEYYGTTTEKIVGRHVSELLGEEQLRRTVEGEHGRALRGETVTTQEWIEYPAAGRRCMVQTSIPALDANGGVIQILGVARDVTDLVLCEERLAAHAAEVQALAEIGRQALDFRDFHQFLQLVSERIAREFDIELVKVLEKQPGEGNLLLVAGVGWKEGLVGRAAVPDDDGSQAGYTLLTKEPVIQTDWSREKRFSEPELLREHGVVCGISVLIGSLEAPWGILAMHSRRPRDFRDDEVLFLVNAANLIAEVVERRRAMRSLHESQARYKHLLESSPSVIYATTLPDLRCVFLTPNFYDLTGYDPGRMLGDGNFWLESVHPDDRHRVRTEVQAALRNGEGLFRYRFRHAAGYYVSIEDRFRVVRDVAGKSVEVVGAWTDITGDVARDETLKSSEAMLGYIVDTITDAIIVVDGQFRIVVFNSAAEALFGRTRAEMAGRDVHELIPERFRQVHRQHMQAFAERPTAGRMGPNREIFALRADGTEFLIEARISRAKLPKRMLYTVVLRADT